MSVTKRLKRYRGWIAFGALVVIAAAAFAMTRTGSKAASATTYTTESASKGTLSVTVAGTGNLEARDTVDVSPVSDGTIATVKVAEGDAVKKGDVLYTLDAATAKQTTSKALASKRQADESVVKAKIQLMQAQADYSALKTRASSPSSTVSSTDLKIAKLQVTSAKAGLVSAQASASSADIDYEDALAAEGELTVKAPCDGVVWAVNVAEGDTVAGTSSSSSSSSSSGAASGAATAGSATSSSSSSSSSNAPVQIARDGELALNLAVNETDVSSIKAGQDAELTFDAVPDLTVTGCVDSVGTKGTVSSGVVTYDVWVVLDINDARLKSGMSSSATIVTNVARNVLLVSNSAIKANTDGTKYVQVMSGNAKTPQSVTVTTGLVGSTQTVIESGISEGTKVVTKTTTASDTSSSSSGSSSSSKSSSSRSGLGMMLGGSGGGPTGGGPGGGF